MILRTTLVFCLFSLVLGHSVSAQRESVTHIPGLGSLSFPNSGSAGVQDDFARGVLLLHSFEYETAAEHFQRVQEGDPDFALGYWGEAMTHNHPIWSQIDMEAGQAILNQLAPTREERRAMAGSEREAMYLDAIEILYTEGEKSERDRAYMEAMKRLHEAYPDDDEARAFYALSILGTENGTRDFAAYMRAAATAQPVFHRNPNHPGAAHYIIHSFDDPIHAPLGMPAAEAYSEIAPRAAHAQHMTTHIFVALGLWERVIANNIRAMDVQNEQRAEQGREPNVCGHYSSWLHYGYLQVGDLENAEPLMDACYERAIRADARPGEIGYFTSMRALHIIDSGDPAIHNRWNVDEEHVLNSDERQWGKLDYHFVNAYLAVRLGRVQEALAMVDWFPDDAEHARIYKLEIQGLAAIEEGRVDEGLDILRSAAEAEAALPFAFGPPEIVKPTHEILGEMLAEHGHADEAREVFRIAESRTPGRLSVVTWLADLE